MKFGELIIENFMAIVEAKLNLADRGLVVIQGVNEDDSSAESNGTGKSSIPDALSWVWYGTTARGEDGDKLVNRFVGKNCRVVSHAQDGDDVYRATRYRKHKTGKNGFELHKLNPATGAWDDLTKGKTDLTQDLVNDIIGCPYEVFRAAIYAGQNEMPNLPGMTDKQLKILVEEAAGVTVLEKAYEEAKIRLRTAQESTNTWRTAVERADDRLVEAKIRVDEAETQTREFEERRKLVVEQRSKDLAAAAKAAKAKKTELEAVDVASLAEQIKELDGKIAAVEEERAEERRLAADVSAAERGVTRAETEIRTIVASIETMKKELDDVDHKIGCPCDSCARPLTAAEVAPAKAAWQGRIDGANINRETARIALQGAQRALNFARDALDKHRASMTDVSATSALRSSLSSELHEYDTKRVSLTHDVREAKRIQAEIEERKSETNPGLRALEAARAQVAEQEKLLQDATAAYDASVLATQVAELTAKVFSPAGVRARILDEVTPFLNDQTAKYLATLSDGNLRATWTTLVKNAKGELREKFSIEIDSDSAGETFKLISGGEKRKVQIAAALALQDLVANRASKPIELFIGDEIDTALDRAGVERLTAVLDEKARERGSVFIISHQDLKDWCSQQIILRKKDKRAVLEETME